MGEPDTYEGTYIGMMDHNAVVFRYEPQNGRIRNDLSDAKTQKQVFIENILLGI